MAQKGEKHHNAKLTDKKVLEIIDLYYNNHTIITQAQLGKIYGVKQRHISRILSGQAWKHLQ